MGYGLSRLLRNENDWTDLVTYLSERDPDPLRSLLGVAGGVLGVRREVRLLGQGSADMVVDLSGNPCAILEFKVGAGVHGNQFDVYDQWADQSGIPLARRFLVGPNNDPIAGEPSNWSRAHSVAAMLKAWADGSTDAVASALAREAYDLFSRLDREAVGPADAVTGTVSDLLRVRRLHVLSAEVAVATGMEFGQERSTGGANFMAWRAFANGYLYVELQRPRRGRVDVPFELRFMLGDATGDREGSMLLAHAHRDWLDQRAFMAFAGPAVARLLADPSSDGFKRGAKIHGLAGYFGYRGTGQGARSLLCVDVDLDDMAAVVDAALRYAATL
ncbi:hypothetical protein [Nocardia sp. NPDC046763]|uniref:hypothetical protein n=1 Tax=Nocardia sp. NPDC046763 TaxID=3155256 RepID=UPI0033EB4359